MPARCSKLLSRFGCGLGLGRRRRWRWRSGRGWGRWLEDLLEEAFDELFEPVVARGWHSTKIKRRGNHSTVAAAGVAGTLLRFRGVQHVVVAVRALLICSPTSDSESTKDPGAATPSVSLVCSDTGLCTTAPPFAWNVLSGVGPQRLEWGGPPRAKQEVTNGQLKNSLKSLLSHAIAHSTCGKTAISIESSP